MRQATAFVLAIVVAGCAQERAGPIVESICILPQLASVFFDSGGAKVSEQGRDAIGAFIAEYKRRDCGAPAVTVTGHADSTGNDAANQALSLRRAQAIADLLEQGGVPRAKLSVMGRGATQPLMVLPVHPTEQEKAQARALDRRVDISSRM